MRFLTLLAVLVLSVAGMSYGMLQLHTNTKLAPACCPQSPCPTHYFCDVHVHCGVEQFACAPLD
jgi:hypothetical protein